MTTTKIVNTTWYPEKKLVVTHLSGDVGRDDIEQWEASLEKALAKIEENTTFKIFVNLYGFKAVDIDAHKKFRVIIPLTLANYGWKAGYVNLFEEEAKRMILKNTRGIRCVGAAHSHQDETKMNLYEAKFSNLRERYFSDPKQAREWIEDLYVSH